MPYTTDESLLVVYLGNLTCHHWYKGEKSTNLLVITFYLFIIKCLKTFVSLMGHLPFQVFLFSITKKGRKSVLNPSQLPTQSHISTPAEVDSFYQVVDKRAHLDAAVTQQRCCLQHWKLKFVDVTYRWSKLLSWWHLVILVTLFQFSEPLNVNMVVFYTGKS